MNLKIFPHDRLNYFIVNLLFPVTKIFKNYFSVFEPIWVSLFFKFILENSLKSLISKDFSKCNLTNYFRIINLLHNFILIIGTSLSQLNQFVKGSLVRMTNIFFLFKFSLLFILFLIYTKLIYFI